MNLQTGQQAATASRTAPAFVGVKVQQSVSGESTEVSGTTSTDFQYPKCAARFQRVPG